MKIFTGITTLLTLTFGGLAHSGELSSLAPEAQSANSADVALAIRSDPQYPWVSNSSGKSENAIKSESEGLIQEQYRSVKRNLRATNARTQHTIINGGITAFGHGWQWNKMNRDLPPILGNSKDYSCILGNHDIEINRNDCGILPRDDCFQRSMRNYYEHLKVKDLADVLAYKSSAHGMPTNKYDGSFGYINDFGGLYSIHVNNFPTMEAYSLSTFWGYQDLYWQFANFAWLESRLAEAKAANKMIIINMHKPDDWAGGRVRFLKIF